MWTIFLLELCLIWLVSVTSVNGTVLVWYIWLYSASHEHATRPLSKPIEILVQRPMMPCASMQSDTWRRYQWLQHGTHCFGLWRWLTSTTGREYDATKCNSHALSACTAVKHFLHACKAVSHFKGLMAVFSYTTVYYSCISSLAGFGY